jgi:hypothetical protein
MARGRPAVPHHPTKFLNSKKRVIHMTAEGKYVAKSEDGKKVYAPKAHYVKSPGGSIRSIKESSARVPTALRPKMVRKVRSNKYVKRGVRAGPHAGDLARLFASPKGHGSPIGLAAMKIMKRRGRPARAQMVLARVSPGSAMGLAGMKIMHKRGRHAKMRAGAGARIDALLRSMTPK